jgi:hypothetical protein
LRNSNDTFPASSFRDRQCASRRGDLAFSAHMITLHQLLGQDQPSLTSFPSVQILLPLVCPDSTHKLTKQIKNGISRMILPGANQTEGSEDNEVSF